MELSWNYVYVGLAYFILNVTLIYFVKKRQQAKRLSALRAMKRK